MSLKICSVGDIMLGENIHHFGRGIPRQYAGRYAELCSQDVRQRINTTDLLIANCECSLLPDGEWDDTGLLRRIYAAPESALSFFEGMRPVCVLNVANNHFGQHGAASVEFTLRKLEAAGMHVAGRDRHPCVITIGGRIVRIWGVSTVEDPASDPGSYARCSIEALADFCELPAQKAQNEYWILSVHWGKEYRLLPDSEQRDAVAMLAAKGFDLILGHHPHVIQPAGQIESCTVVYSHGNFVFDQNFSRITQQGLLAVTDLESRQLQLYRTRQERFAVADADEFSMTALQEFCKRKDIRLRPLLMRAAMKLELVRNFFNVPWAVWKYFGTRLAGKLKKRRIPVHNCG